MGNYFTCTKKERNNPSEKKKVRDDVYVFQNPEINEDGNRQYLFKVVGDYGCGKTSLCRRYVGSYNPFPRGCIGVDFSIKFLRMNDSDMVKLQLWDIGGQERFGNITSIFYRSSIGAILCFDSSRRSTFNNLKHWVEDINRKAKFHSEQLIGYNIPKILLACRSDLEEENEDKVSDEELDRFCETHQILCWRKTSAKKDTGIDESIGFFISHILRIVQGGVDHLVVSKHHLKNLKMRGYKQKMIDLEERIHFIISSNEEDDLTKVIVLDQIMEKKIIFLPNFLKEIFILN